MVAIGLLAGVAGPPARRRAGAAGTEPIVQHLVKGHQPLVARQRLAIGSPQCQQLVQVSLGVSLVDPLHLPP